MVFYLVGLGLTAGDERDITVRGLEAVKKCDQVWLEAYTSVLCVGVERLEAFYGRDQSKKAASATSPREVVESGCDDMLARSKDGNVALFVVGDVLCATTHTDIALRAKKLDVKVEVIQSGDVGHGRRRQVRAAAVLLRAVRVAALLGRSSGGRRVV